MIINELIIKPDGTQTIEQREVPDDFFDEPETAPTVEQDLMALTVDHEYRITLLELGVV